MKVKFTASVRNELLRVVAHIAEDNPAAARKFQVKVKTTLERLETFPNSGRVIPEFPDLDYSEVIIAPYRFFISVKQDAVWVIAVWHSAQQPNEP